MNSFDSSISFQSEEKNIQPIGRIVSVTGSQAIVMLNSRTEMPEESRPDMGTLLRIDAKRTVTLGLISSLSVPAPSSNDSLDEIWIAEIELVGELMKDDTGETVSFRRGVSAYPRLGDEVMPATGRELALAYSWNSADTIEVGTISQAPDIAAVVRLDDLLGKHFAILGTTGAGKSYSTALVLRQIVTQNKQAHILLLDPHNEYSNSFDGMAEIITPNDLQLPYWLLNFEEIIEVIIGDKDKGDRGDQVEILGDIIPQAKKRYSTSGRSRSPELVRHRGGGQASYSVDTPSPYRLSDLLEILNESMGKLETKKTLGPYKALKMRIESLSHDPRYAFMFGALSVQDHMNDILSRIFRIPVNDRPLTILEMTGLPSEVVNVVVSVLARLSFDIAQWSEGTIPITLVCEEAHRYIPNDKSSGFEPTRRAIARIAKEGRKYGVSLAIITQRPSELDPTILSQCNTVFAMRMSNEKDQKIVSAGVSDAGASMLAFLPSLGTGEAIAFGDGVTLPSRLRFGQLPPSALPRGQTASFAERWNDEGASPEMLSAIIQKWRTIGASPNSSSTAERESARLAELETQLEAELSGMPASANGGIAAGGFGQAQAQTQQQQQQGYGQAAMSAGQMYNNGGAEVPQQQGGGQMGQQQMTPEMHQQPVYGGQSPAMQQPDQMQGQMQRRQQMQGMNDLQPVGHQASFGQRDMEQMSGGHLTASERRQYRGAGEGLVPEGQLHGEEAAYGMSSPIMNEQGTQETTGGRPSLRQAVVASAAANGAGENAAPARRGFASRLLRKK